MEKTIITELNDITLSLYKYIANRYKKLKVDITPIQGRIIFAIRNNNNTICQKDIEEYVPCNKSTISSILNTMEKNGLIVRVDNESDLRKKNIVLTSKSKKIIEILDNDKDNLLNDLVYGISKDEMNLFNDVLMKLKNNIERCKNG